MLPRNDSRSSAFPARHLGNLYSFSHCLKGFPRKLSYQGFQGATTFSHVPSLVAETLAEILTEVVAAIVERWRPHLTSFVGLTQTTASSTERWVDDCRIHDVRGE